MTRDEKIATLALAGCVPMSHRGWNFGRTFSIARDNEVYTKAIHYHYGQWSNGHFAGPRIAKSWDDVDKTLFDTLPDIVLDIFLG